MSCYFSKSGEGTGSIDATLCCLLLSEASYVVFDLPAGVGVDGQPSLLVLRFHFRVLGCEGVFDLQAGGDSGDLGVPWVCQHLGELHQESGLEGRREQKNNYQPRSDLDLTQARHS